MAEMTTPHSDNALNPTTQPQEAGCARLVTVTPPASCKTTSTLRILRLPEVIARVGLKRASIYLHMVDGSFPRQISLGARAVGWLEHEIDAWLTKKIQARKDSGSFGQGV